jgi:hypothetical protein
MSSSTNTVCLQTKHTSPCTSTRRMIKLWGLCPTGGRAEWLDTGGFHTPQKLHHCGPWCRPSKSMGKCMCMLTPVRRYKSEVPSLQLQQPAGPVRYRTPPPSPSPDSPHSPGGQSGDGLGGGVRPVVPVTDTGGGQSGAGKPQSGTGLDSRRKIRLGMTGKLPS